MKNIIESTILNKSGELKVAISSMGPEVLKSDEIIEQFRVIERGARTKEVRYIDRILRKLPGTRRKLCTLVLRYIAKLIYPAGKIRENVLSLAPPLPPEVADIYFPELLPTIATSVEVEAYFFLLLFLKLIDDRDITRASMCSISLLSKLSLTTRHTMDPIGARAYYYYSLFAELNKSLADIRKYMHMRLRFATLRKDVPGQSVLINCLLRNYLHYALFNQADMLLNKCVFPESASNNEWARYFYYLGRIKAAKLEYSAAEKHLIQAMRKAPHHSASIGFRQAVQKVIVVVQLLLGHIPERQVFRQAIFRKPLAAYFELTQAVREGNLKIFGEVVEKFEKQFELDHTYTLILRLRHNVIKAAIRAIGLSYVCISIGDIAKRLMLDSVEDAEFIVSKAVRDGVIEASLDSEEKCLRSRECFDIYNTREPQLAFHERIAFCLQTHNQCVKAMRYAAKTTTSHSLNDEERRERQELEAEWVEGLAEDNDDGY